MIAVPAIHDSDEVEEKDVSNEVRIEPCLVFNKLSKFVLFSHATSINQYPVLVVLCWY